MVRIDKYYIGQLAAAKSIFDMAAICYKILEEEIANPLAFISNYVDETPEDASSLTRNPNQETLRDFSDRLAELLEKYSESAFSRQRLSIISLIQNLDLVPFMDEKQNQLSVVFTLLSTIDSLVPSWQKEDIISHLALNIDGSCRSHLVYLSAPDSLLGGLMKAIGRPRKQEGNFQETLGNLLFLKRDRLPKNAEAPNICLLSRKKKSDVCHLKAAVITGLRGTHFNTPRTTGSTVIIKYVDELRLQRYVAQRICRKMRTAIRQGAEFILLPEFCVSREILEYIKAKLAEWKKDASLPSDLIAVFPGSTWIPSNDNVQYILDAWGREIGEYYKNTPYRKPKKDGGGYVSCEGLTNPGKHTCILWVSGIGYILPATCRDAIDSEYTRLLVQMFHPAFLMVPAWSSSGSSFKHPLEDYAADYFANSVLCNGCGALKPSASIVGGAAVLGKAGTVPEGDFKALEKRPDCKGDCRQYCGHIFDMDFSPQSLASAKRVRIKKI